MGTLVVIYGLPGTGKTTISGKIKEQFNCERLRTPPYGLKTPDRSSAEYFEAKEAAYRDLLERTEKSMINNSLVIVEGTFVDVEGGTTGQNRLETYIDLAGEMNYHILLLGISCSNEATIARRLIARKKANPESSGSLTGYNRIFIDFKIQPTHPNLIKFDNNASLNDIDTFLERDVYSQIVL